MKEGRFMKKILFALPLVFIGASLLTGCSLKEKVRITYGTYIDEGPRALTSFSKLEEKMSENGYHKGENFLLATYLEGGTCSCWKNFEKVLQNYVNTENVLVYKISNSLFNSGNASKLQEWGLTSLAGEDKTSFAIIKNGEVKKEFIGDTSDFFKRNDTFIEKLDEYILKPNIYYVDQNILDDAIANDDKVLVQYHWEFCPDCQYLLPKVMYPYANKHNFELELYIIDIGRLTGWDPDLEEPFSNFSTSNPDYVDFLRDHGMSEIGNDTFGYDRGFVPTTQYWEDGVLVDASVYFNDALTKEAGVWRVTRSFYSEKRKNSLNYLNEVETKVLEGLIVPESDVSISLSDPNAGSWQASSAAVYHNPLLEAFLDTYAL